MSLSRTLCASMAACGFAAVCGILLFGSSAAAATYYWTTQAGTMAAGNGAWDTVYEPTTAYWSATTAGSSLSPWAAGNDADFYANGASTITVNGAQSVGNITFDGSGYTVSGGTLNLSGGNITANQDATINSALAGSVGLTKSGAGTLTLGGASGQTGGLSGGLTVNGGVVSLTTPQAYSGATTISAGALSLTAAAPFLPVTAGLAYHLDASNIANLTIVSGSNVSAWADTSGNGMNFTQSTAGNQPTYVASGINGLGSVSFVGTNNSYALNNYLVSSGIPTTQTLFIVNTPNAINNNLNGLWGWNGVDAGIRIYPSGTWNTGGMPYGDAALAINGGPSTLGGLSFTPGAPQVLEISSLYPSGYYPQNLGYYDNSPGNNQPGRAYTGLVGEVVAYSGTLTAAQQAAVNAYLDAKWGISGQVGGTDFLPNTTAVNLSGATASLNLGYVNQTIGSLTGVAGSSVVFAPSAYTTLTTGGDNTSTTFAGTLSGDGGLTKNGTGTFNLSGSNSYTGATAVNYGTLQLGNAAALGASPSVTVANSAALDLNGQTIGARPVAIQGSGPSGAGALLNSSAAAASLAGNITMAGATTVGGAGDITLTGSISGGGFGLTKTGGNTLNLSGAGGQTGGVTGLTVSGGVVSLSTSQAYSGATVINAGTLSLNTAPSFLTVTTGLAYHLDASNSANLVMSGGSVSAWNDSSGNGANFTQSNPGNQPTYVASGINGLGAVSFNGTGNSPSTNSYLIGGSPVQTVFIVNTPTSGANPSLNGIWGENGGDLGIRMWTPTSWENGSGSLYGGAFTNPTGGTTSSSWGAMAINGGSLQTANVAFTPGSPEVLEAIGANAIATEALGWYCHSSASVYWSRAYTGLIGEVVAYSGTLTAAQQAEVNAYLDAKWLGIGAGGNFLPTTTTVSLNSSAAALDLGYANQTVAELSGVAGSSVVFAASANSTLTTGGDNNSTTFAGTLSGDGGVAKIGSGTFTISGQNTLTGGVAVNAGVLAVSDNATLGSGPLALGGGTLQFTGGAAAFSGANNVSLATDSVIDVENSAGATLGAVSGGFGLTKTGAGTLTLAGSGSYTGATNVNLGTLQLANAAALGASSMTNVANGAALDLNGQTIGARPVTLQGAGVAGAGALVNNSASAASLAGNISLAGPTTVGGTGDITLSGSVSGGFGLTKTGGNTLTLAGANGQTGGVSGLTVNGGVVAVSTSQAYSGATVIGAGTLNVAGGVPAVLPVTSGLLYCLDASTISATNGQSISAWNDSSGNGVNFTQSNAANQPTYVAGGINGLGAVSFLATGSSATNSYLVGSAAVAAQTVFIATISSSSNTSLNGILGVWGGDEGLRVYPSGYWDTNGFAYGAGLVAVNGGPLSTPNAAFTPGAPQVVEAVGSHALYYGYPSLGWYLSSWQDRAYTGLVGEVVAYSGALTAVQTAEVDAYLDAKWLGVGTPGGSDNFLPATTTLSLTSAAACVNLGYASQTVASLDGVAGSSVVFAPSANTTLTTGGNNASTTFAGVISGDGGLTKVGTGILALSGANAYTGPTTISAGTLKVADDDNRLPTATALTIASGGVLDLGGNAQTVGSLSGSAGAVVTDNTPGGVYTTTLTINAASGATTTFAGNIIDSTSQPTHDSIALVLSGDGELTLSGTNAYSGGTTISGGTLVLADASALPSSGLVTIGSGGWLELGGGSGIDSLFASSAPAKIGGHESAIEDMATLGGAPSLSQGGEGSAVGGSAPAVPEPGTIALLAAGILMLAVARWRGIGHRDEL